MDDGSTPTTDLQGRTRTRDRAEWPGRACAVDRQEIRHTQVRLVCAELDVWRIACLSCADRSVGAGPDSFPNNSTPRESNSGSRTIKTAAGRESCVFSVRLRVFVPPRSNFRVRRQ